MKNILIIEPLDKDVINLFNYKWAQLEYKIDYRPDLSGEELYDSISNYQAIIVGSHEISSELILKWRSCCPDQKLSVIRAGTNTSTINKEAAINSQIIVMNTAGINSKSVLEHMTRRMLDLFHKHDDDRALNDVRNHLIKNRESYYHNYIYNKTLALIGTGAIGSKVAKTALSLGITVKAYSPHLDDKKANTLGVIRCKSLDEAITGADILTIQVPYVLRDKPNPTFKFIGNHQISLLNNGAIIINISRRDVIDMEEVCNAIHSGKISGFSLDTIPKEISELIEKYPFLLAHNKVYLTPSISTASYELKKELTEACLMQIFWYWENNNIVGKVD